MDGHAVHKCRQMEIAITVAQKLIKTPCWISRDFVHNKFANVLCYIFNHTYIELNYSNYKECSIYTSLLYLWGQNDWDQVKAVLHVVNTLWFA